MLEFHFPFILPPPPKEKSVSQLTYPEFAISPITFHYFPLHIPYLGS